MTYRWKRQRAVNKTSQSVEGQACKENLSFCEIYFHGDLGSNHKVLADLQAFEFASISLSLKQHRHFTFFEAISHMPISDELSNECLQTFVLAFTFQPSQSLKETLQYLLITFKIQAAKMTVIRFAIYEWYTNGQHFICFGLQQFFVAHRNAKEIYWCCLKPGEIRQKRISNNQAQ